MKKLIVVVLAVACLLAVTVGKSEASFFVPSAGAATLSSAEITMVAFITAIAIYGAIQTANGEWGKDGTDNLQARQKAIIDSGGSINNYSRWYEAESLHP